MKYVPHEYQKYASEYICNHPLCAVFLDMGLGKTSITLPAVRTDCRRQVPAAYVRSDVRAMM